METVNFIFILMFICYLIFITITGICILIDIFTKYKYDLIEKLYFPFLYINLVFLIIYVILLVLKNA